jgi:ankyrin repeat protein
MTKTIFDSIKQKQLDAVLDELSTHAIDVHSVNEEGQTPLHLAVATNQVAIAAVLLNKGLSPNTKDHTMLSPFIAAAANGFSEMFQLLLRYSPDLTQVNRFGGSALLPSSEKGFIRVVQQALDAGVPVNHVNRLGWTALLEAVVLGDDGFLYRDIVEELVTSQADISIKDFDQKDACEYATEFKKETIECLLNAAYPTSPFTEIKTLIRANNCYQSIQKLLKMDESLEQLYYLGFSYECLNQLDAARYYYAKGFQQDAQFAYYLANLYKKIGDQKQVIAFFDKGAQKGNRSFFIYHKSNYLREIGRHQEAILIMDELLKQAPNRVDYLFHKANSLRSLGKHHAAYEVMIEADKLQPANSLFSEHAAQSQKLIEKNGG